MSVITKQLADALRAIIFQACQGKVLERDACITEARAALAAHDAAEQAPKAALGGDCDHLHLYQRTYAGFVRISAIVAGDKAANAYMRYYPGTALLSLVEDSVALLADVEDTGVPEDKVAAPPITASDKRLAEAVTLLRQLVDIEGPQPGHVMWYRKVKGFLDSAGDEA